MDDSSVRVLLVDDDEEEYVLLKRYLKSTQTGPFHLDWVTSPEEGIRTLAESEHDVCLLDYHLGEGTGADMLKRMRAQEYHIPVILLTGQGSLEIDLKVMGMGASDYLDKGELTPALLERSIRYAIENHRARAALEEANRELEARVKERTAALERSNRNLEKFADIVAECLQEPLSALSKSIAKMKAPGNSEQTGELPRFVHQTLGSVRHAVANMELLVHSVLDYSRIGHGERPREQVDLAAVAGKVWGEMKALADDTGARLKLEAMPTVPGDRRLLTGLFENLFDNAIKFRGGEAPVIGVRAERREDEWLCAVTDNGVGVEDEDDEDVFLMFHKASGRPDSSGAGIGLAMCRKIVQYHGGRMWLDSEPGQGSQFFFTLPIDGSEAKGG